jgi:hypothetical protein
MDMKTTKIVAVCFSLCFSLLPSKFCSAQNQFEANPKTGFYGQFTAAASDNNGGWITGGGYHTEQDMFSPVHVMKYNHSGQLIWSYASQLLTFGRLNQILPSQDGNFMLAGGFDPCDIGYSVSFLEKISPAGNQIWRRQYSLVSHLAISFQEITELQNGSFLAREDSLLFHASASGDSLWTINPRLGMLSAVLENKQGQFLVGTSSGILRTDTSGKQIAFYPFGGPVKSIHQAADYSYFFLSGLSIIHTDSAFQVIANKSLRSDFSTILSCKWNRSGACMAGKDSVTAEPRVLSIDSTLGNVKTFLFPNSHVLATDFALNDSLIVLAGSEQAGGYSSSPLLKSFSFSGQNNASRSDAGILNMSADSVKWDQLTSVPPYEYQITFKLRVKVKNFGTDTLKNVTLNAHSNMGPAICSGVDYFQNFFGLHLMPGDSVVLNTSLIGDGYFSFSTNNPLSSFCVWTAAPNQRLDINHANDKNCSTFIIPFQMGVTENSIVRKLMISPNPSSSLLKIDLGEGSASAEKCQLEILNAFGQVVMAQGDWKNGNQLDISTLPEGMYLIRLKGSGATSVGRFVKSGF